MRYLAAAVALVTAADCRALEEIIVQAQHRQESLAEVPISITVLDGDELRQQGITRIEEFTALAPGLSGWEQGVSTPIYAIRGISTNSFGIGGEASVAVIVDDAYVGRINSTSLTMVDVNRVEVLRGPQGTLFGRNATAGAIVIYNNQPVDRFEGSYRLDAGEDNNRGATLTVNQPLLGERIHQQGDDAHQRKPDHPAGEKPDRLHFLALAELLLALAKRLFAVLSLGDVA